MVPSLFNSRSLRRWQRRHYGRSLVGVPTLPLAVLCSYFLLSTVVVMLHVVLLSKVFGDIESAERSLILFICNVAQLIFTFAI